MADKSRDASIGDRAAAAAGSAIFFAVAPAVVAGVIPFWLTGWRLEAPLPFWSPFRALGAVLAALGGLVLVSAFVRFVLEGVGTPAPLAPTRHLVVGGLYRHVRNPMYIAVVIAITGEALLFGQVGLGLYAGAVGLLMAAFARWVEEPELRERFGAEYEDYRREVPAWWPRLRPWRQQ